MLEDGARPLQGREEEAKFTQPHPGRLHQCLGQSKEGLRGTQLSPHPRVSQERLGLGCPPYRGRRRASADQGHVLVAWVPTEEHGLVPAGGNTARQSTPVLGGGQHLRGRGVSHVLGDRGVGDGLRRGVQAALAAQAAAVAAEAAELPPRWVVGGNATRLWVEGVLLVHVIVVLVPVGTKGQHSPSWPQGQFPAMPSLCQTCSPVPPSNGRAVC